jgi:hypothetical protein
MAKVLVEGYRVTKDGGGLWTGVVGRNDGTARSTAGSALSQSPPKPPKAVSAIKPAKPQSKE